MGIWKSLFGNRDIDEANRFYFTRKGEFRYRIVGEVFYQDNLGKLCQGRTTDRDGLKCTAEVMADNSHSEDQFAVAVFIDGLEVGFLKRKDARDFRRVLKSIGLSNHSVSCDAEIVWDRGRGGADENEYGVKLDI